MEEYLHEGVWFQPLYERGVWGNEVSPQRNTTEDGLEPSAYRSTVCCATCCATLSVGESSTLSVGLILGNKTHQTISKE